MSRQHGKSCRVYYGGRDTSGDITDITIEVTADTHDTHTMGDDWKEATAGLKGWTANFNAFHDPAVGGISRQLETLLGASDGVLSIYDADADVIGDMGILLPAGVLTQRGQPMTVADMVKLQGQITGNGRAGLVAVLLHPLGEETIAGQSASNNNSGSSANGGRFSVHVTAITGTWTIYLEESSNDGGADPFATLASHQFAAAGGAAAYTVEVTGTVEQYLRIRFAEDVAGSITFVAGFARY